MSGNILDARNLNKVVPSAEGELSILADLSLQLAKGDSLAIVGTSGSGKSTLLGLLAGREASGLVLLSGDRHQGAIYKTEHGGQTIRELTSSSMNLSFESDPERSTQREPDPLRVGKIYPVENYGLVDIDWKARRVTVTLKDKASATLAGETFGW